jgi:hypothetical protein
MILFREWVNHCIQQRGGSQDIPPTKFYKENIEIASLDKI